MGNPEGLSQGPEAAERKDASASALLGVGICLSEKKAQYLLTAPHWPLPLWSLLFVKSL